jgi:excisionase family DNA binding protein
MKGVALETVTRWIGTAEAAERLGIEHRQIYQLIDEGHLTAARGDRAKGSSTVVVNADQVEALAAAK